MFSLMRAPSRSAGNSIAYVTVGVLTMIWTAVWYYSIWSEPSDWRHYVCFGLLASGLAVTVIGLLFGPIGGAAKEADNTVGVAPAGPVAGVVPGAVGGVVAPGVVPGAGMVSPGVVPGVVPGAAQPGMMPGAGVGVPPGVR